MKAKWQLTSVMIVVGLCAVAVLAHDKGKKAEKVPTAYAHKKNPSAGKKESIAAGKPLYEKNCLPCHGAHGKGDGEMAKKLKAKPANLADAHMMKEMTDAALFWKISEGAAKGAMPAFKGKLKEQERWHLVNYIRTFAAHAQHGKAATPHKPSSAHTSHSSKESSLVTYTCPMHPEVKSDKPGKCPKCGMKLEKK